MVIVCFRNSIFSRKFGASIDSLRRYGIGLASLLTGSLFYGISAYWMRRLREVPPIVSAAVGDARARHAAAVL